LNIVLDPANAKLPSIIEKSEKFTSRLAQIEVLRTLTKHNPSLVPIGVDILSMLNFIEISDRIVNRASFFSNEITLKTLDAIHMATAEGILDKGDFLLTRDRQMIHNAKLLGIEVFPN
jgi:predicted nucleic acid-binding protein